jgi:hypothetical protein
LAESSFHYWRRELQRRQAEPSGRRRVERPRRRQARSSSPSFVAVRVSEGSAGGDSGGGRIEIALSGGRRIFVAGPVDRMMLSVVVSVLEGLPVADAGAVPGEASSC